MPRAPTKEVLSSESTLTRRGQTTIPSAIRQALDLQATDKLRFSLRADNTVVLTRAEHREERDADPVIDQFLAFLERDATGDPARIHAVPPGLVARARDLTEGVEVHLDVPLSDDDD